MKFMNKWSCLILNQTWIGQAIEVSIVYPDWQQIFRISDRGISYHLLPVGYPFVLKLTKVDAIKVNEIKKIQKHLWDIIFYWDCNITTHCARMEFSNTLLWAICSVKKKRGRGKRYVAGHYGNAQNYYDQFVRKNRMQFVNHVTYSRALEITASVLELNLDVIFPFKKVCIVTNK